MPRGRSPDTPPTVVARIRRERATGTPWYLIARGLERDGVPTVRGGDVWHPAVVRKIMLARGGDPKGR